MVNCTMSNGCRYFILSMELRMVILKKTILFGFFWVLVFKIYAQESYRVIYKVDPINIIENNEIYSKNKTKRIKNILENTIEYSKKERYILSINNSNSCFLKKDRIIVDNDGKSTMMYSKLASLITSFNKKVFVDFNNTSLTFTRVLAGKYFNVYKNNFFKFNWDIKNETKIISGLEAKKALGKYYDIIRDKEFEITAWFIPSIPIPAGPDIYFGLPGLIGEIHLRKAIVKIESIEKFEEFIKKPSFENVMTYDEYEELVAKGNEIIKREY